MHNDLNDIKMTFTLKILLLCLSDILHKDFGGNFYIHNSETVLVIYVFPLMSSSNHYVNISLIPKV